MEADWGVEVGPDAPAIVVPWDGFVDLRNLSSSVQVIREAASHPPLREALIRLNSKGSRTFTSKCDIWWLRQEEIDNDEFGARPENAISGFASYIDILLLEPNQFRSFGFHEFFVRRLTQQLRELDQPNCRVDLEVRAAVVDSCSGYGITIYAAGCGQNPSQAQMSWQEVLHSAVNATIRIVLLTTMGE
jgi:hypothetical protein